MNANFKPDFPLFEKHPNIVFFDSGASSQKPKYVIDKVASYYSYDYANIHRGVYDLSQTSEDFYHASKQKIIDVINGDDIREVIYTYNSTYAANLISQSLKKSNLLKKGDKVLLSIAEHHANIVPWLILKEEIGIEVEFVGLTPDFDLDISDFKEKYDEKVKVISLTHVSNVTGTISDLETIGQLKRDDTIFIVDGSQSIPHIKVDVKKLNCDMLIFTGHKVMAETGIGVLWGKKDILESMESPFSGGGAIAWVKKDSYKQASLPAKFEPGTPNLGGAVSLLGAFEYIDKIGGYEAVENHEKELTEHMLGGFKKIEGLKMIGKMNPENRIGVFTFVIDGIHPNDLNDFLADNEVCLRGGQHCTEPLMDYMKVTATARASLYLYNTKEDVDKFFEVLNKAIKFLK